MEFYTIEDVAALERNIGELDVSKLQFPIRFDKCSTIPTIESFFNVCDTYIGTLYAQVGNYHFHCMYEDMDNFINKLPE